MNWSSERRTGLLFQPGNVEQLAGAISFLYDRPDLAPEMGTAGLQMVRERHSPEAHCHALGHLYHDLVGSRKLEARTAAAKPRIEVAFIGGRGLISKYSGIETYYEEVGSVWQLWGTT